MSSVRVVWLFSLARSGSSVAVYASASALGHAVADEVLGPWDRTGPPYNYPEEQGELVELFKSEGHRLTPRVVALTGLVMERIAGPSGVVISKWPHLRPSPSEWTRAFPGQATASLIRNPLHRLNSLHCRGWTGSYGEQWDLDRYRRFIGWWRERDVHLSYDEFGADARGFFARLWKGWGLEYDDAALDRAEAYAREHYHASSAVVDGRRGDAPVLSERERSLPPEAVEAYLGDERVSAFMEQMGWSIEASAYLPGDQAGGSVPARRSE